MWRKLPHLKVTLTQMPLERSSLPSKNFPCISMEKLEIGALFYQEAWLNRGNFPFGYFPCEIIIISRNNQSRKTIAHYQIGTQFTYSFFGELLRLHPSHCTKILTVLCWDPGFAFVHPLMMSYANPHASSSQILCFPMILGLVYLRYSTASVLILSGGIIAARSPISSSSNSPLQCPRLTPAKYQMIYLMTDYFGT